MSFSSPVYNYGNPTEAPYLHSRIRPNRPKTWNNKTILGRRPPGRCSGHSLQGEYNDQHNQKKQLVAFLPHI